MFGSQKNAKSNQQNNRWECVMNIENEIKLFLELQGSSLVELIEYSKEYNIFRFKITNTNLAKGVKLNKLNYGWKMWQDSVNREGFVLVPVEPTEDMTIYAIDNCEYQLEHEVMASIYKDMIEASQDNKDD